MCFCIFSISPFTSNNKTQKFKKVQQSENQDVKNKMWGINFTKFYLNICKAFVRKMYRLMKKYRFMHLKIDYRTVNQMLGCSGMKVCAKQFCEVFLGEKICPWNFFSFFNWSNSGHSWFKHIYMYNVKTKTKIWAL